MRKEFKCFKDIATPEGVRKVPISNSSLTGEVLGVEFESTLERDLILLMVWEGGLASFQAQPIRLSYVDQAGSKRSYTPDLLFKWAPDSKPARAPLLCEVKPREKLREHWNELRPKFRAARNHCLEQGWEFRIFDEGRIRTPYLANVQFLWRYRHSPSHRHNAERVVDGLRAYDRARLRDVIDNNFDTPTERGQAIWSFWVLVAHQHILCDMSKPLTPDSQFWLPEWRRASRFD